MTRRGGGKGKLPLNVVQTCAWAAAEVWQAAGIQQEVTCPCCSRLCCTAIKSLLREPVDTMKRAEEAFQNVKRFVNNAWFFFSKSVIKLLLHHIDQDAILSAHPNQPRAVSGCLCCWPTPGSDGWFHRDESVTTRHKKSLCPSRHFWCQATTESVWQLGGTHAYGVISEKGMNFDSSCDVPLYWWTFVGVFLSFWFNLCCQTKKVNISQKLIKLYWFCFFLTVKMTLPD